VATGENEWHELQLQPDALVGQFRDQLIVSLRSDWEVKPGLRYGTGSLLVVSIKEFVELGPQGVYTTTTACMHRNIM
jgi:prolyl oligopeptidase PreP (S9A serine peptidase family)